MNEMCLQVRVRAETRRKLDAVKLYAGWTFTEAVDRLVTDYIRRERVPFDLNKVDRPSRRLRSRASESA